MCAYKPDQKAEKANIDDHVSQSGAEQGRFYRIIEKGDPGNFDLVQQEQAEDAQRKYPATEYYQSGQQSVCWNQGEA